MKIFLFLLLLIVSSLYVYEKFIPKASSSVHKHEHKQEYTCAMHPSVRTTDPKEKCPICHMDLTPVASKTEPSKSNEKKYQCKNFPKIQSETPAECPVDGTAMVKIPKPVYTQFLTSKKVKQAGLKLYTIQAIKKLHTTLKTTGKIAYDERNMSHISAQFSGRIEKLWLNYEGQFVKKGDRVLRIYSTKLIQAQHEYLSLIKNKNFTSKQAITSSKHKLKQLGMTAWQIKHIQKTQKPIENITIYAPFTGIVVKKYAHEKMYFKEGENFFDIINLSTVWGLIDIPEEKINHIKLGNSVKLKLLSQEKTMEAKIEYIDPVLNPKTRTATARITLNNKTGKFLPNMFFYADIEQEQKQPENYYQLPREAILNLGRKKLVFKDIGNHHYEAWQVELVDYNEQHAIIKKEDFLQIGDNIVQRGAFILDSQSQISGNASSLYGNALTVE